MFDLSPTTANPCEPYFSNSLWYPGISFLHGPHHVAQTSTRTTLPRRLRDETTFPCRSFASKSGSVEPTSPAGTADFRETELAVWRSHPASPAINASASKYFLVLILSS